MRKTTTRKRYLWVYVIFAGMTIVGGLTACTKDDPQPVPITAVENIVGEWRYIAQTYRNERYEIPGDYFLSFTEDGNFLEYGDYGAEPGTYEILTYKNKNYIYIHSYTWENCEFLIETLTQNDLVFRLEGGDNQTLILKRKQTSTLINYAEAIVGRWALRGDEANRILEIESNGNMHYINGDATINGSYEISGNQLNVDCGPYEGTFLIIHISPLSMTLYLYDNQNGGNYYCFNKIAGTE